MAVRTSGALLPAPGPSRIFATSDTRDIVAAAARSEALLPSSMAYLPVGTLRRPVVIDNDQSASVCHDRLPGVGHPRVAPKPRGVR